MVNKKQLKKVSLTKVIQQSAPKAGVPKSRKISNLGSFCRYVAFVGLWYGFTTPIWGPKYGVPASRVSNFQTFWCPDFWGREEEVAKKNCQLEAEPGNVVVAKKIASST